MTAESAVRQRHLHAWVIAPLVACVLMAGCTAAPSGDTAQQDQSVDSSGDGDDTTTNAGDAEGQDDSGAQGSGQSGEGSQSTSRRGSPGAPVGGSGEGGERRGTPIAILPFDNIGGPVEAFELAVADRIANYCDGDPGCFNVRIEFVDAPGDEEPCTILAIAPNPPTTYGETVTATATHCEPDPSASSPVDGETSSEGGEPLSTTSELSG